MIARSASSALSATSAILETERWRPHGSLYVELKDLVVLVYPSKGYMLLHSGTLPTATTSYDLESAGAKLLHKLFATLLTFYNHRTTISRSMCATQFQIVPSWGSSWAYSQAASCSGPQLGVASPSGVIVLPIIPGSLPKRLLFPIHVGCLRSCLRSFCSGLRL